MRKTCSIFLVACLALSLAATGCAPNIGASDYSARNIGAEQSVKYGTVDTVRKIDVAGDNDVATGVSTVGGGVVGGVLGSLIGGGAGRTAATVGGALLGSALGYGGSKLATGQEGYEITVRLDSGQTIAVTQGTDISFARGQKVRVLNDGERSRVLPMQ